MQRARPGRRPRAAAAPLARAIERRCSAGFAMHRVARGERGGDLAGEDREREIPRADADEHAAAGELELVALAGRPGQSSRRGEQRARARRSSGGGRPPRAPRRGCPRACGPPSRTQERDELAPSRSRSGPRRLAASARALAPPASRSSRGWHALGGSSAAAPSASPRRRTVPIDCAAFGGSRIACAHRASSRPAIAARRDQCRDGVARARARARRARAVREIQAARVHARAARTAARGSGIRGCATSAQRSRRARPGRRRSSGDRRLRRHEAIHERGVRAVLEQAPHEIRQQVLDGFRPARKRGSACSHAGPTTARVQLLAHAVQTLELERLGRAGTLEDRRDRVRVVRRELRDRCARRARAARARTRGTTRRCRPCA